VNNDTQKLANVVVFG